jgi:hypothetical protein
MNTTTVNPNQDQTVDQEDVAEFGDDDALNVEVQDQDQRAVNVAVPIAISIDIDEEEVPRECPAGFTFKPETGQCGQTQTPECPEEFAPENGQCRSTETTEPT